jgi:hypothetical protein
MGVSPIRQEGNDKMNDKTKCLMNDKKWKSCCWGLAPSSQQKGWVTNEKVLNGGKPHPLLH